MKLVSNKFLLLLIFVSWFFVVLAANDEDQDLKPRFILTTLTTGTTSILGNAASTIAGNAASALGLGTTATTVTTATMTNAATVAATTATTSGLTQSILSAGSSILSNAASTIGLTNAVSTIASAGTSILSNAASTIAGAGTSILSNAASTIGLSNAVSTLASAGTSILSNAASTIGGAGTSILASAASAVGIGSNSATTAAASTAATVAATTAAASTAAASTAAASTAAASTTAAATASSSATISSTLDTTTATSTPAATTATTDDGYQPIPFENITVGPAPNNPNNPGSSGGLSIQLQITNTQQRNVTDPDLLLNLQLSSLQEVDETGTVVQSADFPTDFPDSFQGQTNCPFCVGSITGQLASFLNATVQFPSGHKRAATVENSTTTVDVFIWTFPNKSVDIVFGDQSYTLPANNAKIAMQMRNWPFLSKKNSLLLHIGSNTNQGICKTQQSDENPGEYIEYLPGGYAVKSKYLAIALVDGEVEPISTSRNRTSGIVTMKLPSFTNNISIDPDLGLLFRGNGLGSSKCPEDRSRRLFWIIVGSAVAAAAVLVVIIIIVLFLLLRKKLPFLAHKSDQFLLDSIRTHQDDSLI